MKNRKVLKLEKILKELGSIVVAYSGGVDSTYLLKVSLSVLGKKNVLAVIARSETYPSGERRYAEAMSKRLGSFYKIIHTSEIDIKGFKKNPENRCYFCKKELFKNLKRIAKTRGLRSVADGSNHDDLSDWRPGSIAAGELGIRSPLAEARLSKNEIRLFSRKLKLPTWDKPSFACLASRFPYHTEITKEKIKSVDAAENFLKSLGFRQMRVRSHNGVARIEVEPGDLKKLLSLRKKISEKFKSLKFSYIAMDLDGYRTGSMNETIRAGKRD